MMFQGPSLQDVDAAVKAVLAELFPAPRVSRSNGLISKPGVEIFSGTLFSLRQAETLSPRTLELLISPGTVVTPLARDFLKRLGVIVRFVAKTDVARLKNAGEWGFVIESEQNRGLLEAFRRALLEGNDAWTELGTTLDDAANWIAESEGRGALLLADESSIAVYQACQKPWIRAATACDPDAVSRATRSLGMNLLVVEPAGKSIAFLNQMGRAFRRAGGPNVPDWLNRAGGLA